MAYEIVSCKYCNSSAVVRYGTQSDRSRFRCKTCLRIFKTDYAYRAYEPGIKEQIVDMAVNGSGIQDTSRVLGIGKNAVISTLKKVRRNRARESLCRLPGNLRRDQASH